MNCIEWSRKWNVFMGTQIRVQIKIEKEKKDRSESKWERPSENRIDEKAEGNTFIYYSCEVKDHTLSRRTRKKELCTMHSAHCTRRNAIHLPTWN